MAGYQMPEWIRISIGTTRENQRCLEGLEKSLGKR
jgi:histidinol-phosphate/aromatic aminotransferase/cobyric acid decarboxylase-like protein